MGWNDSYSQARSQILMMSPTPTVNEVYGLTVSDEGQKSVAATSGLLGENPTVSANHYNVAMYTGTGHGGNQKFKKNYNIQCDFCKIKGHSKENCYKIVGYPPEFKNRKKGGVGNAAYNVMTENNVHVRNTSYNGSTDVNSQANQFQASGNSVNQVPMYTNTDTEKFNYIMGQGPITQLNLQGLPPITNYTFLKEQYEKILQILNKSSGVKPSLVHKSG
nr:uncharacterized protein LOC117274983 isoform X1 [Nicotiana tomentosiformis]